MRTFFVILFVVFSWGLESSAQSRLWVVTRSEWTERDEENYSAFVQSLGRAKCTNVHQCMTGPGNPYRDTDPQGVQFYSDCADFPYFLRSYFAWKNGLPFSYVSSIRSVDQDERAANPPELAPGEELKPIDNRYSQLGNYPYGRIHFAANSANPIDFFTAMSRLQNIVFSGMLRMGPQPNPKARTLSDFYSPAIQRGSIRPGTTLYDPNGHVAVVYEVLPDGRILHFDAHPDNSVTQGTFSSKFSRGNPAQGAGFKNFRPLRLVGDKIVFAKDEEIPDLDVTQYFGTHPDPADWRKGRFEHNGRTLNFHEYVRTQLATEKISPVVEFQGALEELCSNFKDRSAAVETALEKQIHLQAHPTHLPPNLFGSEGDWENYSTPGRDTRLRATFLHLKKNVEDRYQQWLKNDFSDMKYEGKDLKRDLLRVFHGVNLQCPVSYKNSNGQRVNLGFEIAIRRLFALSFDPYHCPELRWGASHPEELKSCRDDQDKRSWYTAQQAVRNHLQRDWSSDQPISKTDLQSGRFGSQESPVIDLRAFLEQLPEPKGKR